MVVGLKQRSLNHFIGWLKGRSEVTPLKLPVKRIFHAEAIL